MDDHPFPKNIFKHSQKHIGQMGRQAVVFSQNVYRAISWSAS